MAEIILPGGKATLVDDLDADLARTGCWLSRNGYVVCRLDGRLVSLHREILGRALGRRVGQGETVHHVNGSRSDNRRANLALATWSENQHAKPKRHNRPGFLGVRKVSDSLARPWRAFVRQNKREIHVGYFATAEEAAKARDIVAKHIYGEFASLNYA